MTENHDLQEMLDQLRWVIENSEGVKGLRLDRAVMPWNEVIDLYVPALKGRDE